MHSHRLKRGIRCDIEIFAVVSGSFRRHLPQIQKAVTALSKLSIKVLSPDVGTPVLSVRDFIMLDKDKGSPNEIERAHLTAIARSDFLYVVNPKGYIGNSAAFEIGYALSNGVPVFLQECPQDEVFRSLLIHGVSLRQIKRLLVEKKTNLRESTLSSSPTIADLQSYVASVVKARGFSKEDLTKVALLLVEEVGELAKAVRAQTGIKVSEEDVDRGERIDLELADCLIYLLDLANLAGVNLEDALRKKEALNAGKRWVEYRPISALSLSAVEVEVLTDLSKGSTSKEIAQRLQISEQTLKRLETSILRKLDHYARSQAQARLTATAPQETGS